jgi:hypothetical protein
MPTKSPEIGLFVLLTNPNNYSENHLSYAKIKITFATV